MGEMDHWGGLAQEIGSPFVALLFALSLFSGMLLMLGPSASESRRWPRIRADAKQG
jgi:hypothetical protein